MRVLLVEDDARLSASLAASLGDAGYAVDTVGDGEQAELSPRPRPTTASSWMSCCRSVMACWSAVPCARAA